MKILKNIPQLVLGTVKNIPRIVVLAVLIHMMVIDQGFPLTINSLLAFVQSSACSILLLSFLIAALTTNYPKMASYQFYKSGGSKKNDPLASSDQKVS